jgi:hypothetical protein
MPHGFAFFIRQHATHATKKPPIGKFRSDGLCLYSSRLLRRAESDPCELLSVLLPIFAIQLFIKTVNQMPFNFYTLIMSREAGEGGQSR